MKFELLNIKCPEKNCDAVITFRIHEHQAGFPSCTDKKTIIGWSCDKKGETCNRTCEKTENFQMFKNVIECL